MRMLYPDAVGVVDPVAVYADLPRHDRRPGVRLNMIVSVDGGTSWGGVSGGLGGPADKALFSVLRSFADVVLVAAGTMRAEQYGPAQASEPVQKKARRLRGQEPIPRITVVSRSCQMDWDTPFFTATVAAAVDDHGRGGARGQPARTRQKSPTSSLWAMRTSI